VNYSTIEQNPTQTSLAGTQSGTDQPKGFAPEQASTDETSSDVVYKFIGRATVLEFWCPFCGGWHGGGPPPSRPDYNPAPAPRIPEALGKVVTPETTRRPSMLTNEAGRISGEPAKVRRNVDTGKMDVYWGGEGTPDGRGHGHVISNDGLNANYVREPGPERNDIPVNDLLSEPYANLDLPRQDESGRYDFS